MKFIKLLYIALLLIFVASGLSANDIETKLKEFKESAQKAKTDQALADLIRQLGQTQDEKILKEITQYLTKKSDVVREAAADVISGYKNNKNAATAIVNALGSQKKNMTIKFLNCLGDIEHKPSAKSINKYISDKDIDVAKAAITTCGEIKSKDSIDPLIKLLKELELIKPQEPDPRLTNIPDAPGNPQSSQNKEVEQALLSRKNELTPLVQTALSNITGESITEAKDWEKWWRDNKSKFKEK